MTKLEMMRRAKGLSQEELGKEILYSRCTISRLESKQLTPNDVHPRLRGSLERYFDTALEDLMDNVEVPK